MTKSHVRHAIAVAFAAVLAAPGIASAIYETEPNEPIASAQRITVGAGGAQVTGVLGVMSPSAAPINDVDFYAFEGTKGDVLTVDIDGGAKQDGTRSVDTFIAVFGPGLDILAENDDPGTLDPGSSNGMDARLENVVLPASGTYIVGVSSYPRTFRNGGTLTSTSLNSLSNGSYTLVITGVTSSPEQHINIEIKPGNHEIAPINPTSKGNIPVALISSEEFDALKVDRSSLTFGASGHEQSLRRCGKGGQDVNADGLPDLVCHFDNQAAKFERGDLEGIVRGISGTGRPFEGRGRLKVVPEKRHQN